MSSLPRAPVAGAAQDQLPPQVPGIDEAWREAYGGGHVFQAPADFGPELRRAWMTAFRIQTRQDGVPSEDQLRRLRAFRQQYAAVFDKLLSLDFAAFPGDTALIPQAGVYERDRKYGHLLYTCSEMLTIEATLEYNDGHYEEAVRLVLIQLRLHQRMPSAYAAVDLRQLRRCALAYARQGAAPETVDALSAEIGRSTPTVARLRQSLVYRMSLGGAFYEDPSQLLVPPVPWDDALSMRILTTVGAPVLNQDAARYEEIAGDVLALAAQPYWQARPDLERLETETAGTTLAELRTLSLMTGGLLHSFTEHAEEQAESGLTQLALQLEMYRQQHGDFPPGLESLSPTAEHTALVDPFSGQPYRYERTETGYLLYSVGVDGEDNHADDPSDDLSGSP
ncbi:MAG: hypothetical protein HYV26_10750 [Candidatus Hydrogenedentes bacterium]|nr:hypothetical protein [Candidatus Hydrogenedentota bacterium]